MNNKKELTILFWMIAIFAMVFFMPLGNERFMTAIDATLDLAKWYAQEHVVLCLLPAFLIAGVIAVFVSQGAVLKYFGANAKKWLSYTIAAISGGILAVCSCTILPLFTSIYKRGAGLGPAIAFLYSGPAISILSIILTARILGVEMGIARIVGAITFSIIIGLLMSFIFRKEEKAKKEEPMNIARCGKLHFTFSRWYSSLSSPIGEPLPHLTKDYGFMYLPISGTSRESSPYSFAGHSSEF